VDVASKLWIEPLTTYLIHSLVVLSFENLKSPKKNIKSSKTTRLFFFSVMHNFQALGGDRVQQVPMRPLDAQAKKRAKEQRKLLGSTWPFGGFLKEGGKSCNMKSLVKN